ncbi:MAG: mechanosensitive ion channel [Sinobacteraceae bacterium]|nr:mechanosensitive ion channel [Nevskiaceae bacterium]
MQQIMSWLRAIHGFFTQASIQLGNTTVSADSVIELILLLLASWWVARLLERALIRLLRHRIATPGAYSAGYAIGRLARYAVWIIGSFICLQAVGLNLSNFALVGGALGIGIGFGMQNVVGNFVSGVILLVERSLKVGDFVDLASGVRGTVTEIAVRYTRVTTNSDVDVIVPNSEFTNARVINWTLDNRFRRINVPFNVAYGSDKNIVRQAGLAAAQAVPHTITDATRRTDVWFTRFGENALQFELVVWIGPSAVNRPGATLSAYLWALDDALRARNIELPLPQRQVLIRSVADFAAAKPTSAPPSSGAQDPGADAGAQPEPP